MRILLSILLFTFCTAVLSQDPETPTTTTDAATDTPSTTTEIDTTTLSSSSSSVAPTTTVTSTPSTSSTSSTTPSTTRSSTTVTSTVSPATSTIVPEPEQCSFNVTRNNETCIRAEIKAEFEIDIQGNKTVLLLGCDATSIESDCSLNETKTLILYQRTYNLTIIFEKDANKVFVRNVTFSYTLPQGRGDVANNSGNLISMRAGNSFLCNSEFNIDLENVTMKIYHIHIQAFGGANENFGTAETCEADDKVGDIVPIAVGVALGALIIIVLIAYLVGRRRSRQKGYQSV